MGYFPQPFPLVTVPPVKQWPVLELTMGQADQLVSVNMPALTRLVWEYSTEPVPWSQLQGLRELILPYSSLSEAPLWQLPELVYADFYNAGSLHTIDAHGQSNLVALSLSSCTSLTTLDISGCTSLYSVNASYLGSVAVVEQLLSDLVTLGMYDGNLSAYGNGAISPAAEANAVTLTARGWYVYYE